MTVFGYAYIAACGGGFFQVNRIKHAKTLVWCLNIIIKDAGVKRANAEHCKVGVNTPSKRGNAPYTLLFFFTLVKNVVLYLSIISVQ